MQAPVFDRAKFATFTLIVLALSALASCATKEPVQLVDDPSAHPESSIPWNKQEKWELGGGIPSVLGESR